MSIQQVAERISRLSQDSMAKGVLDEIGKEIFTMSKVRKALDKIFTEPPNTLVRLVRLNVGDDSIKPAQVKKALSKLWTRTSEVEITPALLSVSRVTSPRLKPRSEVSGVDTIIYGTNSRGWLPRSLFGRE